MFIKHDVTVCHKGFNLLQNNFSKLKSEIPTNKKTHTVYQVPCKDCPSVYIGQTIQYLQNRLNGHKYDRKNITALKKHEQTLNHKFDFTATKILKTEAHKRKREYHEMIFIKKNAQAVNDKADIAGLNKIYYNLLN